MCEVVNDKLYTQLSVTAVLWAAEQPYVSAPVSCMSSARTLLWDQEWRAHSCGIRNDMFELYLSGCGSALNGRSKTNLSGTKTADFHADPAT